MAQTFFFYDLETSGLSARSDRVMQFAGQRTDLDLNPIGEPYNVLVRLNDDTLPSPDAIMVTKISPQQTLSDGLTEAEFAKLLTEEICTEDTVVVGFNNIRFDDEFIRHLFWRTFHDPYEWCWRDGRSRWDMLDVVRMTRALRPEGIIWPVDSEGNPTNRLELLTKENGISHEQAHDALSDVWALIQVTKLIKTAQPQLYEYLLTMRDKNEIKKLINLDNKQPFVYTSGRYEQEHQKTTVAFPLTSGKNGNVVVYDLRYDPKVFIDLSTDELAKKLFATYQERKEAGFVPLPVKELQYNRAPAVAPLGVLEKEDGWNKIHMSPELIERHKAALLAAPHFAENVRSLFEKAREYPRSADPEARLYDSFVPEQDKIRIEAVRNSTARELVDFHPEFTDERLAPLLLHYKARNFPRTLSEDESVEWEAWRSEHIKAQLPQFLAALRRLAATADDTQGFLLQELQLWAESIVPIED